jgi:hypothetical protein
MDTAKIVAGEIRIINRLLQAHGVRAYTSPQQTAVIKSGFIRYGLRLAAGEQLRKVESIQREFAIALTRGRKTQERVPARLSELPPAIEVPHPCPEPLLWSYRKLAKTAPHTMLAGRSYLAEPKEEYVNFDDAPHTLIAGITGAGKSVLLQTMLLSLCLNTPPGELQLVICDLKNEDMLPFRSLPHVVRFAGTHADAVDAIQQVQAEKDARVADPSRKPYRLILVVDELAQLAQDKVARDALGDLASIGRSKWVHLLAATQHPTKEGGMGALMKANFGLRLVGLVAPGQAHVATGLPGSGAHLLPGKGSFLRCERGRALRFQGYFIALDDVQSMAGYAAQQWRGQKVEPLPMAALPSADPARIPDALVRVFEQYMGTDGQLLRGGLAAALRALHGDDAPTAGKRYQMECQKVNAWLEIYFTSLHHDASLSGDHTSNEQCSA